jgi:hypothetical protein
MAVTNFEVGKYYAHPSKEHNSNWDNHMDAILDGLPHKCIDVFDTNNARFEGIGGGRWCYLFDEFIEVPDWSDDWEFIGNAEQAAGRKIETGDENLVDGKWYKIQICNGIDLGKYITIGKYVPVRRRKVSTPDVRLEDKLHGNCKYRLVSCSKEPCKSCIGKRSMPNWESADSNPTPSGRIVNIEDAPIGARVRIVYQGSSHNKEMIGWAGIKTGKNDIKHDEPYKKYTPYIHTYTSDARVELLDEPKEEGGEMYLDKFVRGIVMKGCHAGDIIDVQVSGTVSMSVHVPSSEKSYAEKDKESADALVQGILKSVKED